MSRIMILPVAIAAALLAWFWWSGGFDQLAAWAAGEQRLFQNRIAQALRALRGGQAGAWTLLLSVCFAYGFFHAVGPGHGKILIGGYGVGRDVPWLRLATIAMLSSLGQALTAILFVYGGILVLGLTRDRLVGMAEGVMAPASFAAIALVGLWLAFRGGRRALAVGGGATIQPPAEHHHHHHDHDGGGTCDTCGHRHGPTLDEVDRAGSWREMAALVGSIAIRPCTGALFVLIITWQMGIGLAGVAGALAMALGTASVTVAVGLMSSGFRSGLVGSAMAYRVAAVAVPVIEVSVGLLVAAIALGLMWRAL